MNSKEHGISISGAPGHLDRLIVEETPGTIACDGGSLVSERWSMEVLLGKK